MLKPYMLTKGYTINIEGYPNVNKRESLLNGAVSRGGSFYEDMCSL